MDRLTKESIIMIVPIVTLLVLIGMLTNYNILATALGGAIGGLIGKIILRFMNKEVNNISNGKL